jgi:hypothetical protein
VNCHSAFRQNLALDHRMCTDHCPELKLAEAERRNADLEARLRRCEQAKRDALAERDAARSALAASAARGAISD